MAPIPELFVLFRKGITPAFYWPVKFCVTTTAATYILSIITGNVSQVDRVWTVS